MVVQRWLFGRDSYRPVGEPIDPSRYGVELIDFGPARDFVVQHHYSGSMPASRAQVGLFRGRSLVGVAVFSVPMQQRVIPARTGQPPERGVELGRFVLLDDVPANGETWFLKRAFLALREALPAVRAVVSYSDPVERRTASGRLVKPGHVGTIYRAFNGRFLGHSSPRTLLLARNGSVMAPRALSKVRNDEQGARYAYEQLLAAGAPRRQVGESGRAYIRRIEGCFRKLRHPGNLTYVWALDRRARRLLPEAA